MAVKAYQGLETPVGVTSYGACSAMWYVADTAAELPTVAEGILGYAKDTKKMYVRTDSIWKAIQDTSAILALFAAMTCTGNALKHVRVNTGGDGLELVTLAGGGDLVSTNNLSDVASAAVARTNLELGTAAITAVTDYATAAQGVLAATALQNASAAWPIGSVFMAVVNTNPATLLGFGTWAAFAAGRCLVGLDAGQTEFDTVEETGGAKAHTLTAPEMPVHTHTQDAHTHTQNSHTHALTELRDATTGGATTNIALTADTSSTLGTKPSGAATATNQNATAVNQNAGGGGAHNNLQPYIVVYMWKRTA